MKKEILNRLKETEAFLIECHEDGPHRGEADCSFYLSVRDVKDAIREIMRLRSERDELRQEVERLRAGGCARDQTVTQFCAEAEQLRKERDELRQEVERLRAGGGTR